jgi:hypothetical protein
MSVTADAQTAFHAYCVGVLMPGSWISLLIKPKAEEQFRRSPCCPFTLVAYEYHSHHALLQDPQWHNAHTQSHQNQSTGSETEQGGARRTHRQRGGIIRLLNNSRLLWQVSQQMWAQMEPDGRRRNQGSILGESKTLFCSSPERSDWLWVPVSMANGYREIFP